MTAPPVEPPRFPADGRFRFGRSLVAVEAAITTAEVVLVLGPTLALAAISLQHARRYPAGGGDHRRADDRRAGCGPRIWCARSSPRATRSAPGAPWTPPRSPPPNALCAARRSRSRSAAGCCGRWPRSTSPCTSRRAACSPGRRRSASPASPSCTQPGRRPRARRCGNAGSTPPAGWCCRTSIPCATSPPATGGGCARPR